LEKGIEVSKIHLVNGDSPPKIPLGEGDLSSSKIPLGEGGDRGIEFKRFTSPSVPLLKKWESHFAKREMQGDFRNICHFLPKGNF